MVREQNYSYNYNIRVPGAAWGRTQKRSQQLVSTQSRAGEKKRPSTLMLWEYTDEIQ